MIILSPNSWISHWIKIQYQFEGKQLFIQTENTFIIHSDTRCNAISDSETPFKNYYNQQQGQPHKRSYHITIMAIAVSPRLALHLPLLQRIYNVFLMS